MINEDIKEKDGILSSDGEEYVTPMDKRILVEEAKEKLRELSDDGKEDAEAWFSFFEASNSSLEERAQYLAKNKCLENEIALMKAISIAKKNKDEPRAIEMGRRYHEMKREVMNRVKEIEEEMKIKR